MAGAERKRALAWMLAALPLAAAAGGGPVQVVDLYEADEGPVVGSDPELDAGRTATIGLVHYFSADDGIHGRELWRSDGTPEGTWLVHDIAPGAYGSEPDHLVAFGGEVCFVADDGSSGREPWCSDGTAAGTRRLADVRPGRIGSLPRELVAGADRLYFTATDGVHGNEPWSSDGTVAGTQLLRDVQPGPSGSGPSALSVAGGVLFFAASTSTHGRELWRSNGSAGGTVLVRDIVPGAGHGLGTGSGVLGTHQGVVYFSGTLGAARTLWRSDGSFAGTVPVTPGGSPASPFLFTSTGRGLLFVSNSASGLEFWCSDGTEAGTQPLGLPAGLVFPGMFRVVEAADGLYIPAGPSTTLWRSDCTAAGTMELTGASEYHTVFYPTVADGTVFFAATSPDAGNELHWVDNGEVELFADIVAGTRGSVPEGMVPSADGVLFSVRDELQGRELRFLDDGAIWPVRNIAADAASSRPRLYAESGGRVFLSARGDGTGRELWASDGSAAGTELVADTHPGLPSAIDIMDTRHGVPGLLDGALLYLALQFGSGREPWRSDGSPAGTALLADACPGICSLFEFFETPPDFIPVGALAFFDAPSAGQRTLWRTDGTAMGTAAVLPGQLRRETGLHRPHAGWAGRLLFAGADDAAGTELWASDGTAVGTQRLLDLRAGPEGSLPQWFTAGSGKAFFTADDGTHGNELWLTDGTPEGTRLLQDLAPGPASSMPQQLVLHQGVLYFSADDGVSGAELWRSDGTPEGTWQVADIVPGPGASAPRNLRSARGVLYFSAFDPQHGVEPWLSTGTAAGTRLLMDMVAGPLGSVPERSSPDGTPVPAVSNLPFDVDSAMYASPFELLDLGDGRAVFRGCTAATGCQLWITDTTVAGTRPLTDVGPVPGGAMPGHLQWLDGRVLFAATDSSGERELWTVAIAPRPSPIFRDGYEALP